MSAGVRAVGIAGTLLATFVAAMAVAQPDADRAPRAGPGDYVIVRGTEIAASQARDPDGEPRWELRTHRSESGKTCLRLGQVDGARFGRVFEDGRFAQFTDDFTGSCLSVQHLREPPYMLVSANQRETEPTRTAFSGIVGESVRSVEIEEPGKGPRELSLSPQRTFLVVYEGDLDVADYPVTATLDDGSRHTVRLEAQPAGEGSAPPVGGELPHHAE